MLNCIAERLRNDTGVGINYAVMAYAKCGSYAVAKEYLKLKGEAIVRYKVVDGKRILIEDEDYIEIAKCNVNKDISEKLIEFIEEGPDKSKILMSVQCNMDINIASELLSSAIEEIESLIPKEEWNANGVVRMACEHVFGNNVELKIILPDTKIIF